MSAAGIPHYGVYLLTGIILWNYFIEATGNSVTSMVAREGLLRKIRFPRMVVPLSTSLTAVFNLSMNLIAVLVFTLANGVSPAWSWLWMIPIVLGFIVLATGMALLLSALFVRFRDIQPIWDVSSQVLFYASPIMYTAIHYHSFEHLMLLNPIALMLTQMGYAFIHPRNRPAHRRWPYRLRQWTHDPDRADEIGDGVGGRATTRGDLADAAVRRVRARLVRVQA